MIYPDTTLVREPNEDLNDEVKEDYLEAASILEKSPRGSSALLRLALQKLCIQLGKDGDLNKNIKELVSGGLSVTIQQALDVLRVIGNNSVHPGKIDMKDDKDTARALFELINHIAEITISEPKKVQALYDSLPEEARKQIEERDSTKK